LYIITKKTRTKTAAYGRVLTRTENLKIIEKQEKEKELKKKQKQKRKKSLGEAVPKNTATINLLGSHYAYFLSVHMVYLHVPA